MTEAETTEPVIPDRFGLVDQRDSLLPEDMDSRERLQDEGHAAKLCQAIFDIHLLRSEERLAQVVDEIKLPIVEVEINGTPTTLQLAQTLSPTEGGPVYSLGNPGKPGADGVFITSESFTPLNHSGDSIDDSNLSDGDILEAILIEYAAKLGIGQKLLEGPALERLRVWRHPEEAQLAEKKPRHLLPRLSRWLVHQVLIRKSTFESLTADEPHIHYGEIDEDEHASETQKNYFLRKTEQRLRWSRLVGLLPLIPIPGYSTSIGTGAHVSWPKPALVELADDVLNHSEHERQGFDSRGIHLPLYLEEGGIGSTIELFKIDPRYADMGPEFDVDPSLFDAPEVNAKADEDTESDSGRKPLSSQQDLYGGPRHAVNLLEGRDELAPNTCADVDVNINFGDHLRAGDAVDSRKLAVGIYKDKLLVCNFDVSPARDRDLSGVYVEVVKGRVQR